jgi:RNA polymerase sigma factor (sigma-70 family)
MPRGPFTPILHFVRSRRRAADDDADLLARFATVRGEDSFAELVRRHGPLVFGVARQVLRHDQDAEDTFQATFLLLARNAARIRSAAAVAGWLHGTAWRVANKARARAAARQRRERSAPPRSGGDPVADASLRELQAILHAEVAALPAKYRTPFVLCVLEGRGRAEVARLLGWNEGTLSTRLAWARQRLRSRLLRRGVDLAAALAAVELTKSAVPAALAKLAVAAAQTGVVPTTVAALANGGIMTTKAAQFSALALVLGAIAAGSAGLMGSDPPPAPPAAKEKGQAAAPPAAPPAKKPLTCPVTVTGTATGPDGKPAKGAVVRLTVGPRGYLPIPDGDTYRYELWSDRGESRTIHATTKTDASGRYRFDNVAVPVYMTDTDKKKFFSQELVIGTAEDGALTWSKPAFVSFAAGPDRTMFDSPTNIDLAFERRTVIAGRIADERSQLCPGASILVDGLWRLPLQPGESWVTVPGDVIASLLGPVVTDAGGRFELIGLPPDHLVGLRVEYPDRSQIHLHTTTELSGPLPENLTNPLDDLDMAGGKHRILDVHVTSAADRRNLSGAMVHVSAVNLDSSQTTGEDGKARLRVLPGCQTLSVSAPRDSEYVFTSFPVTVEDQPLPRSVELSLVRRCRFNIEAVDVDSRKAVPNLCVFRVREAPHDAAMSYIDAAGVAIKLGPSQEPISEGGGSYYFTNANGKVALLARPGPTKLDFTTPVNTLLPGGKEIEVTEYTVVNAPKMPLDLKPGGEINLRIEVRKKGPPRREPFKPAAF